MTKRTGPDDVQERSDTLRDIAQPTVEVTSHEVGAGSTPDMELPANARSCWDKTADGPHAVSPTNPPIGGEPAAPPPPAPLP